MKGKKDKWFFYDLFAKGVMMFAIYFGTGLFLVVLAILVWAIYNGGG